MTLLVVSLYLPHTVHFTLADPSLADIVATAPILSRSPSDGSSAPVLYGAESLALSASGTGSHAPSILATSPPVSAGLHPPAAPVPSLPSFIQSLASQVTSALSTPLPSPPIISGVENFFFKQQGSALAPSSSAGASAAGPVGVGSSSNATVSAPTTITAIDVDDNFRSAYQRRARSFDSRGFSRRLSASLSQLRLQTIPSPLGSPLAPVTAGIASPDSSSAPAQLPPIASNNGGSGSQNVVHPKSRANSPPPAKHIVATRRRQDGTLGAPPSLRVVAAEAPTSAASTRRRKRATSDATAVRAFSSAPWTVVKFFKGNGGLRNAIARAEAEGTVADVRWVGTLGMPTDVLDLSTRSAIEKVLVTQYSDAPVFVSDSTMEGHYTHYCKDILWPTFHYQIPDNPKSKAYEDHSWVHYYALNKAFADAVVSNYTLGDTIWVNDYHLMLVPGMVREQLPDARIGFFLHIAFPSSEVFRCLASRKQLLRGILGADLVGFQSHEYARHFRQTCQVVLGAPPSRDGSVMIDGRRVNVVDVAIGIDPPSLKIVSEDPEVLRWRRMLRARWPDKKMIVGRDKLDQFRGVRQKLLGYERFLQKYPEYKENAVFIQVCLTNIASQDLESEVSEIVSRINSSAHVVSDPPVVFLHQDISFEQYLALLYEADVFVVTSLREGMNLTCHEYIFCQNETSKGPLILSEFTGSAAVLGNECLLVNPWDRVAVADAFEHALTMSESEKEARHAALFAEVMTNTCAHWVRLFLNKLDKACAGQQVGSSDESSSGGGSDISK
ncbi:glycosyltransferase family 20-domain-containing protein [Limtongia smithiae]|uniref:glycosyltransferase family 20-domain-containing protein n=1 Tax=Limtongia smithiae TaxID=1125753 RepID=UPI0034CDF447